MNIRLMFGTIAIAVGLITLPASASADPVTSIGVCPAGRDGERLITPTEYGQLEPGMLRSEVAAIVGAFGRRGVGVVPASVGVAADEYIYVWYRTCRDTGSVVLAYANSAGGRVYAFTLVVDFD